MKNIIICTILLVFCSNFVYSQSQSPTDYNKYEVFAGYSENSLLDPVAIENFDSAEIKSYKGWNSSVTYNFKRYLGVKADVSGHYKKFTFNNLSPSAPVKVNTDIYNILGGIQLKDNKKSKRFSPFAHTLVGVSTSKTKLESTLCSVNDPDCNQRKTGFSMGIGGGLDLKVKKNFSIRLIQVDYNPAYFKGFTEHRVRAGFGIVFH
jgi:opacity protein-like surface antigen